MLCILIITATAPLQWERACLRSSSMPKCTKVFWCEHQDAQGLWLYICCVKRQLWLFGLLLTTVLLCRHGYDPFICNKCFNCQPKVATVWQQRLFIFNISTFPWLDVEILNMNSLCCHSCAVNMNASWNILTRTRVPNTVPQILYYHFVQSALQSVHISRL